MCGPVVRLFKGMMLVISIFPILGAQGAVPSPSPPVGNVATVNGRKMYYEQYGQGRILVLLPGGLATIQRNYENQIPVLSAAHQVIAIEQVGHGHTPDANIEWSYPQMADDTAALLGILKVQNADLIGHSDGAILALLVARRHPELVRRLVISGANTRLVGMTPEEAKEIQASSPEQLAEKLGPDRKAAYLAVSPDGPSHWPMAAKKIWNLWITPIILEKEDLLAIKAPALVVCGDRDIIPIQHTLEIFNTLPNAQLLVIPGCGHLTFTRAANTLNPIMLKFIDAP